MALRTTKGLKAKLALLQQEIRLLHRRLLKTKGVAKKRGISLEGIWEGVEITDKDMEEAKLSLFSSRSL